MQSPQQRIQLKQQPRLVLAPPGTVAPELLDDGRQGLVLLHGEERDALGRGHRRQDVLVEHVFDPLPHNRLVRPAVRRLPHHLGGGDQLI